MNVLVAPDKFKGCLSAQAAARLMAWGARRALPAAAVRRLPLADGGDGTAAVLGGTAGGRMRRTAVRGPRGGKVRAAWAWFPKTRTAVIDMAQASGLALLPPRARRPLSTTSYGTGELIRAALRLGARNIWVGLGGSATVDGGLGMLQALGARAVLADGRDLAGPAAGRHLFFLERVDFSGLDPRLKAARIVLLCDVDNPLLGPRGAARAFGPQKGASPRQVFLLEKGLRRWARVLLKETAVDTTGRARMGSAGGAAAGLTAALHARARSGADAVMESLDFDVHVRWADVVVTGEGSVDQTSLEGKVLAGVLGKAKRLRKPVLVIAGRWGKGAAAVRRKVQGSALIAPRLSLKDSLRLTPRLLPPATEGLLKTFLER